MDRDRAAETLRSSGQNFEAAWLEAFAPTSEEFDEYLRDNAGNPSGHRSPEETDSDFVRRIGFLFLAWRRAKYGESADERELGNSWHAVETLFAVKRPHMLQTAPWEFRPGWDFDDEDDGDEDDDTSAEQT